MNAPTTRSSAWRPVLHWLASTPRRTFILYPLCVIAFEFAVYGQVSIVPWGVPLLLWGYLQYRLVGNYRHGIAKGGRGMDTLPERLVTEGPYRYLRNPMYLGHLIFMAGLALTFLSWLALAILLVHLVWYHRRVLEDEARLTEIFGAEYTDYRARVKRWIPGVY